MDNQASLAALWGSTAVVLTLFQGALQTPAIYPPGHWDTAPLCGSRPQSLLAGQGESAGHPFLIYYHVLLEINAT